MIPLFARHALAFDMSRAALCMSPPITCITSSGRDEANSKAEVIPDSFSLYSALSAIPSTLLSGPSATLIHLILIYTSDITEHAWLAGEGGRYRTISRLEHI